MSPEHESQSSIDTTPVYRILIEGHIPDRYSPWFDGMEVRRLASGRTLIAGPVADQPALHALLRKVRDLGLAIVSVARDAPTVGEPPERGGP